MKHQFLIIIVNILIIVGVAAGVMSYAVVQHYSSIEMAEQAFINTSEMVRGIADNYLLDVQTVCNGWAKYINANSMTMNEAIDYLAQIKVIAPTSAHLIRKDTLSGFAVSGDSANLKISEINYADGLEYLFEDMTFNDGISITTRYKDPVTGSSVLSFCRQVSLDDNGEKRDAIVMRVIPVSYLDKQWVFPSDYSSAEIAILKGDGKFILDPDYIQEDDFFTYFFTYNQNTISQSELTKRIYEDEQGYFYGLNAQGEDCIWTFRQLKNESQWNIIVSVPRSDIKAKQTDWVATGIIILGLAVILFIDLGFFAVTMKHNKKIQKQLEEQTDELTQALDSERESKAIIYGMSREYNSIWVVRAHNMNMVLDHRSSDSEVINFRRTVTELGDYTDIMNKYADIYVFSDDRAAFLEETAYENVLKQIQEKQLFSVSYRRTTKDKTGYYQLTFSATDSTDDFVMGFRNINDMMEEKQRQADDLAMALAAAEHANRAKTVFLNNMSHDIRTPMNAIIGFTALAASHINNQAQVKDYLSKISLSSEHLLSLINDVLDMSRIESGKVKVEEKDMHLPDLLHDLRTIMQANVNAKNLELFVDTVDVHHEDIIADRLRLNQILLNITSNAIKFTKPGGIISIRIIEKSGAPKGYASFEFRVKDTGIGMAKEFKEHIFEAFSREETSTVSGIQGTGLGMAITKNIVDMMGGTISVDSEPGVGTEFVVSLQFRISENNVIYEPIPELQGLRALVADDDLNTCASVTQMLIDIGMRSEWTTSGREAIFRTQLAVEQGDEFNVYIIDWLMPDMNGIETVRRIRKIIGDGKPIIILTAYDWADIEEEAREAGVTAFCFKPIFMSELREVLTQPVATHRSATEPDTPDFTGKHILLVEDNELNREIATAILEEAGFTIDTAEDGTVAVDIMSKAAPGQYDLILMDVQMPKMNGYDATKLIRALPNPEIANLPIIAMTANAFEEDKQNAIDAGMNGHLAKPIEIPKLMEMLSKILTHNA